MDTRDTPGTFISALYYAFSTDGGQTWSANEKLSDFFDPSLGYPNQEKMGDYFHMYSDNDGASLAWCGTFNGEQDVYYGRITQNSVPTKNAFSPDDISVSNSPNPFKTSTRFTVFGKKGMAYNLTIFNQFGQKVREMAAFSGESYIDWDGKGATGAAVPNGVYYAAVRFLDGKMRVVRSLKVD